MHPSHPSHPQHPQHPQHGFCPPLLNTRRHVMMTFAFSSLLGGGISDTLRFMAGRQGFFLLAYSVSIISSTAQGKRVPAVSCEAKAMAKAQSFMNGTSVTPDDANDS
ncbi:hypothetical protein CERZMDRAFT_87482 [Cercospora zeae-maydis SCOH1-5]|uniref:Uncharacterized protein n=1 Tax=Cercospora zeae-maydis SCOH1-5 TaxID=717836 RepID=A0A6A6F677_9PEZI|nr:hypothetical protein CERZMDRAFT_87482 [Cercospora zeae-maydis SCOH1-5]